MADKTFLAWPFFDDRHRSLAGELERWASDILPPLLEGAEDSSDAVYACVKLLDKVMADGGVAFPPVPKTAATAGRTLSPTSA